MLSLAGDGAQPLLEAPLRAKSLARNASCECVQASHAWRTRAAVAPGLAWAGAAGIGSHGRPPKTAASDLSRVGSIAISLPWATITVPGWFQPRRIEATSHAVCQFTNLRNHVRLHRGVCRYAGPEAHC